MSEIRRNVDPVERAASSKNARVAEDTQTRCASKTHSGIIGSLSRALARDLTNQLRPCGEQLTSYVKNVDHFIDILSPTTCGEHRHVSQFRCNFAIPPSTKWKTT
ncbi:hypothetical protein Trydic_g2684 [Trypoxylus dichotomus]